MIILKNRLGNTPPPRTASWATYREAMKKKYRLPNGGRSSTADSQQEQQLWQTAEISCCAVVHFFHILDCPRKTFYRKNENLTSLSNDCFSCPDTQCSWQQFM